MSKKDLEATLLNAIIIVAKQVVKETVVFVETSPEWTLDEAEDLLQKVTRAIPEMLLHHIVTERCREAEGKHDCRQCGKRMRDKGAQSRQSATLVGSLRYTRHYYHCPACGLGRYPADESLGIEPGQLSDACQSALSCLGAALPFRTAADLFRRLTTINVSGRQTARMTERRGAKLDAQRTAEQQAMLSGWSPDTQQQDPGAWCVSLDAAKVHFMDGWHDVKAGVVYKAQRRFRAHEDVYAQEQSYLAQIGSMEQTGERLYAEAVRRGICPSRETVACVADGAPANWTQFALHFPQRIEALDWFHATQHLWTAAKGVWGEGSEKAQAWVASRKEDLWAGNVAAVLQSLRKTAAEDHGQAAQDELHYFEANQLRMDYAALRKQGYPRGSGTVESACKQLIIARARLAGMRWSASGLQAVLSLRAELLSNRWDTAWPFTRHAGSVA